MNFSDKDPDEEEYLGFNFAQRLASGETISTVTFAIVVVKGADASASAMLQGAAVIDGATVKQLVGAGVAGVHYLLSAEVTTSAAQVMVEAGFLIVRTTA
jgi:hypothetical protein